MQFTGPYAAPKVFCDHCGAEITDATDGNYQWTHADGSKEGQTTPMVFTHKACCDAFEHSHGDPYAWSAIGLECLPYFLARNLHVTWRQAHAAAQFASGG
jgi:hypothetical protein